MANLVALFRILFVQIPRHYVLCGVWKLEINYRALLWHMTSLIFASSRWKLVDQHRGYCCKSSAKMLAHLGFNDACFFINAESYTFRINFTLRWRAESLSSLPQFSFVLFLYSSPLFPYKMIFVCLNFLNSLSLSCTRRGSSASAIRLTAFEIGSGLWLIQVHADRLTTVSDTSSLAEDNFTYSYISRYLYFCVGHTIIKPRFGVADDHGPCVVSIWGL